MKARCIHCKEMWSISWKRKIPKSGYVCPACFSSKKSKSITKKKKRPKKGPKQKLI